MKLPTLLLTLALLARCTYAAQLDGAIRLNSGTSGTNTTSAAITIQARTNLNAGKVAATNSVVVGRAGEAGVVQITSTNGTYTLTLSIAADGSLAISNNTVLVGSIAAVSGYTGTGASFLTDNGTYQTNAAGALCELATGTDIDPTGATDSTAGFERVIAEAVAKGYGRICVPPGKYGINLTILDSNVVIEGCGVRDVNNNTTIVFFPWDVTKYVIQVGDDSRLVNGFGLKDVAVLGLRGTTNALGALYFAGGAYHGDVTFCQFLGGADTVKFKAGVDWPSTLNALTHCAFWEGTNSTVMVDDTRTGAGYCTGNKIAESSINGFNTGGQAITVIRGRLNVSNTYLDGNDGFSILSDHGGILSCVNCDLENASGQSAVLLTVNWVGETYSSRDPSVFVNGGVRMQGQVAWIDDTGTNITQLPTGGGLEWSLPRPLISQPWTVMPQRFGTTLNPTDGVYQFDMAGTNGPFYFQRADSSTTTWVDRTLESRKHVGLGDTNTFLEFDFPDLSTAAANVYFFRGTTTVGNRLINIFKGDGSASVQSQFNGFGSSFVNALSGNFGIGTASPSAVLEVNGNAKLDADVTIGLDLVLPAGEVYIYGSGAGTADFESLVLDHQGASGAVYDSRAGGTGTYRNHVFQIGATNLVTILNNPGATNTPFTININGAQQRVYLGPADSGGTGMRALVVPN